MEDAIVVFENIMNNLGGETLLKIFVKYEKILADDRLYCLKVPKRACFGFKRVSNNLNASFDFFFKYENSYVKIIYRDNFF